MSSIDFPETGRVSPVLELRPGEKTRSFIQSTDKIRRLVPRHVFSAEFVHLLSPSAIYLRLTNHITKKLEIPYTNDLKHAEIKSGKYVMAPIRPDTLGRARIIEHSTRGDQVYVFFIDAGECATVSSNHLFEIPKELAGHPWQVITVKLHGLDPVDGKDWSHSEVDLLDDLLHRYPYFWVVPKLLAHYPDDNNFLVPADIYGLTQEEHDDIFKLQNFNNIGDSILDGFHLLSVPPTLEKLKRENGSLQKSYHYYNKAHLKQKQLDESSMVLPPESIFFNITPFPQLKPGFNRAVGKNETGFYGFFMKSKLMMTPNLFFAFRLDKTNQDLPNDPQRFLRFRDEIQEFSNTLNDFYCNVEQCVSLNFGAVHEALKRNTRVFGIVHGTAVTNFFTMHYQRVEILDCIVTNIKTSQNKDVETADIELRHVYRVRYIDTGGIELVSKTRVYQIHPKHIEAYPFSYMLSYSNLKPLKPVDNEWPMKALRYFNDELLLEMRVFEVTVDLAREKDWTKPLYVKAVKKAQAGQMKSVASIDEKLIQEKYAVKDDSYQSDMFAETRYLDEKINTEKWMEFERKTQ
uniref:Tudor domain-containing protein n=1 Tax=Panagrellus redivivus TaxID=6233 RepID=A0A7E4ULL7_PANRE